MTAIQSSLYTAALTLCLFSTGILNGKRTRHGKPLSYFVLYLALESLCFALELLLAHPAAPLKALWLGLLMAASLLIAPCLWLAIKEAVEGIRPNRSAFGWGHRAVVAVGILLTLPLLETAHLGADFENPLRAAPPLLESMIHETMLLCIALFAVQVPFYLWRCRALLLNKRAPAVSSWLQVPLIIVCTTWLLGIARTLTSALSDGSQHFFAMVAFIDVGVTIGCVYFIVRSIMCEAPPAPQVAPAQSESMSGGKRPLESKYAKSQLDAAVRTRIVRKLDTACRSENIYRDSGLTLGSLAKHMNENEHYVSQVLNQELATSFYEFLNRHRIEQAKKLLVAKPDENVLDIALSVGFNAKSTFNNAFRRQTGMTPRAFRAAAPRGEPPQHTRCSGSGQATVPPV